MPPSASRAALAAAGSAGSDRSMVSLASSLGSMHITNRAYSSSSSSSSSAAVRCCRQQLPSPLTPAASSSRCRLLASPSSQTAGSPPSAVYFSTTASLSRTTKMRQRMIQFYKTRGERFLPLKNWQTRDPEEGDQNFSIFPKNPQFKRRPILGEPSRELVWSKVVNERESVKAVAAQLGIDMRRVAAVVRLKQIEKSWVAEGKPLAKHYTKAIMDVVPHTTFSETHQVRRAFEPINEVHMHKYTKQQLFLPVAESRHFTREDAAKAFHVKMLSADKRMPIPELVDVERDILTNARDPMASFDAFREKTEAQQLAMAEREKQEAAAEDARTANVNTDRFQFRIRDINSDNVGRDGRSPKAVGWRYGMPFYDRKRGRVKIPTSVG